MTAPNKDTGALRLDGKVAVVAGGTGALGNAIAAGFVQAGATCVITGTNADRTKAAADAINASGVAMDVADEASVRAACESVCAEFGGVDVLVNSVGGNRPDATTSEDKSFFDLHDDAFREVMDLNFVHGTVRTSRIFGAAMKGDGGSIINISSMAASRPLTRVGGYAASKAAVNNFTQWLAVHLAHDGHRNIRVNAIAPGFFLSDQNRYLLTDKETGERTPRGQTIVEHTPLDRFGQPDDLVGAAVWLASDASTFVTGAVIPVDGGFSAFSGV